MAKQSPRNFERVDSFWAIYLEMLSMIDGGNWANLCSIIDDDRITNAIMQAMGSTTLRIPTVGEHAGILRAAIYAYYKVYVCTQGKLSPNISPEKYRKLFGLTEEDYKAVNAMYREWVKWVSANGIDPNVYGKLTKTTTRKNIPLVKGYCTLDSLPECLKDYAEKLQNERQNFLKKYRVKWHHDPKRKQTKADAENDGQRKEQD